MKRFVLSLGVLSLFVLPAASSQAPPKLALDPEKPIVYLEFDHAGPRIPEDQSEPSRGIWLRLVNNSLLTIRVSARNSTVEKDRPLVRHWMAAIWGVSGRGMPSGYGGDVGAPIVISPGKSLVFSVPENHVSASWGMEVPFQFDLPAVKHGYQPTSEVRFDWSDLPKSERHEMPKRPQP